MKVKELIARLQALDGNLDVYCYEEGPVVIAGPGPFDIVDVSKADVELKRIEGKPAMMFGSSGRAVHVAIIGLTPDF
jgi:acetamidase/formamidase